MANGIEYRWEVQRRRRYSVPCSEQGRDRDIEQALVWVPTHRETSRERAQEIAERDGKMFGAENVRVLEVNHG